eukprot:TRINITY_DN15770_c0_g1_i1.p1 TRINITY_DN15770_c0_g1~~TRINITY_DN15770_c0_g1_i1.p1  ORF type:complete len:428 (+),score=79.11 TRINITY_DN15770_c0_g1_i1:55-1338(+)
MAAPQRAKPIPLPRPLPPPGALGDVGSARHKAHRAVSPLPLPKPVAPPLRPRRRSSSPSPVAAGGRGRRTESPDPARRTVSARTATESASARPPLRSHSDAGVAGRRSRSAAGSATFGAPAARRPRARVGPVPARQSSLSGTQRRPKPRAGSGGAATSRSAASGNGLNSGRVRSLSTGARPREGGAKRRSATPSPPPPLSGARATPRCTPGGGRHRASSPPTAGQRRTPLAKCFASSLPLPPRSAGKSWTVVLDLDQTLINAHAPDDRVIQRPGLQPFLETLGELGAERVLWTASNEAQVRFVLRRLGAAGHMFEHVVSWDTKGWTPFRGRTSPLVKDLTKLRRPLSSCLLVDNDPEVTRSHPHNAIVVEDFGDGEGEFCDSEDRELDELRELMIRLCQDGGQTSVPAFVRSNCFWSSSCKAWLVGN